MISILQFISLLGIFAALTIGKNRRLVYRYSMLICIASNSVQASFYAVNKGISLELYLTATMGLFAATALVINEKLFLEKKKSKFMEAIAMINTDNSQPYTYYVAYAYETGGLYGFGSLTVTRKEELNYSSDIKSIKNLIEEKNNLESVIVLNFIPILAVQRPENNTNEGAE